MPKHVLAELESFHEMIPVGGFILIYDTSIEWDDAKWQDRDGARVTVRELPYLGTKTTQI